MNTCKWTTKGTLATRCRFILLIVSLIIMILDQITKYIARKELSLYELKAVINNCWNWTLAYNRGAAFSFLNSETGNWPKIFFGAIAFIVSIWLINFILSKSYTLLTGLSLSFVLGGATGNLVDRIIHGKVTDFIDWYYMSHHWPAFNLADSFICIGVALLIIEGLFLNKDNKKRC